MIRCDCFPYLERENQYNCSVQELYACTINLTLKMSIFIDTVNCHVLTRSRHELTQAWAGQSQFNIGGLAGLGRAHIRVLNCDEIVLKHDNIR